MAREAHPVHRDGIEQMIEFPCMFNLSFKRAVTLAKIRLVQGKLEEELREEDVLNDPEQTSRNKNVLTWIYFYLDRLEKATDLNNEVVESTRGRNMTALGNQVFLMWYRGNHFELRNCLENLQRIKSAPDFDTVLAIAKAEQAYCHSRLGSPYHNRMALTLYQEALITCPDKALWEYGKALAYQRLTNPNLCVSDRRREGTDDYVKMAAESLFRVCNNIEAGRYLKSLAYAQLVSLKGLFTHRAFPQYDGVFQNLGLAQLRDMALNEGSSIPAVLNACAKGLQTIDPEQAILYLLKSIRIKNHNPVAYHLLASCYIKLAERMYIKQHGLDRNTQGQHNSTSPLRHYCRPANRDIPLRSDDDLVLNAIAALRENLRITNDCNLSGILSLGIIFKKTNQLSEALHEFNKIVSSPEAMAYKLTMLSALEEAGLCYLQLSEDAAEEREYYKEEGKKQLTMAMSCAVELVLSKPESKDCLDVVWTSFRRLSSTFDGEDQSLNKAAVDLLRKVSMYSKKLPLIDKLRCMEEEKIQNAENIKTCLTDYLHDKQYEDGILFMNLLELYTAVATSDNWTRGKLFELRMKVALGGLHERLSSGIESGSLFQQLFKMTFGLCAELDEATSEDGTDSASSSRDVLILFDVDQLTDHNPRQATRYGRCLKHVLSTLCGLDAEENLRGNFDLTSASSKMDIQLAEIKKYRLVVIVLGDEDRSPDFEAMLARIPCLPIRVLDVGGIDSLRILQPCIRANIEQLGSLTVTYPGVSGGAGVDTTYRPVHDVFQGDIEAVMRFFCFILGQQWPHLAIIS